MPYYITFIAIQANSKLQIVRRDRNSLRMGRQQQEHFDHTCRKILSLSFCCQKGFLLHLRRNSVGVVGQVAHR